LAVYVPMMVNHFLVEWREFLESLCAHAPGQLLTESTLLDEVISTSATLVTALRLSNDVSDASPYRRNAQVMKVVMFKMLSACREIMPLTLNRLRVEACVYKVLERYLLHMVLDPATLHRVSQSPSHVSDSPMQNAIVKATEDGTQDGIATARVPLDCLRILGTPSYETAVEYCRELSARQEQQGQE